MRSLSAELNRAIFSRGFAAGVVGTAAVLCVGGYGSFTALLAPDAALQPSGAHATALLAAMTGDTMLMALPVLAALPCTAGFVEDLRSGFLKHCLPRAGRRGYIGAKAAASAITGALAIVLGVLLAYGLFLLAFLPAEARPAPEAQPVIGQVLAKAAMLALSGGLWSLVGLACSTATASIHMAYASPFILYYALVILVARYLPGVAILSPQEWLKPRHPWPGGNWGLALLMLELAVIAASLFAVAAARRLRNE